MSRHKIGANTYIFELLDGHCVGTDFEVPNAGSPRWISTARADSDFLVRSEVVETLSISSRRKLGWFTHSSDNYLVLIGFSDAELFGKSTGLTELELTGGHLTTAIFEMRPKIIGSPQQISDIVGYSDRSADSQYSGHDVSLIASLFPTVRVFHCEKTHTPWSVFFRACVSECKETDHWLTKDLLSDLETVAELDPAFIPYRLLSRSIFDSDPSSFFLALYRCLEAIFAYASAKDIVSALRLTDDWATVAAVLEDKLGWWPREESSLERLLRLASKNDLELAAKSIRPTEEFEDSLVYRQATSRIYGLRNSIVHYRPAHQKQDMSVLDWSAICKAMAAIVLHVYGEVFYPRPTPNRQSGAAV